MPFLATYMTTIARNGSVDASIAESTGSSVIVTIIPPIRRIGARTPILCIEFIIWWILYVSLVIRDISVLWEKLSTCPHERFIIAVNVSFLKTRIESLATDEAILFAVTLPSTAINAQTTMTSPHCTTLAISASGTTSSIIYASIHGSSKSITVPENLTINPTTMWCATCQ